MKIKKPGTTLIEVIVSLFVIESVIVGSVFIVSVAFKSAMTMRDNLIAQNLAREGVEVVRKIVNTNLIRYSNAACWNYIEPASETPKPNEQCGKEAYILDGNYVLNLSEPESADPKVFKIKLEPLTNAKDLDLSKTDQQSDNESYHLKSGEVNNGKFYTSDSLYPDFSKFYRMIKITPKTDTGKTVEMGVKAVIQWGTSDNAKSIELSETFYNNYQK